MRITPVTLTVAAVLTACVFLMLLRFGGTRQRISQLPSTTGSNIQTRVVVTHREEELPLDTNIDDLDDIHDDNDDHLFELTPTKHSLGGNDNQLPYTVPAQAPITRLKYDSLSHARRRAQFAQLFRSPLSSGYVNAAVGQQQQRRLHDDGFDRVWLPALNDIEAARSALLLHQTLLTPDQLRISEVQLANDMIIYKSWRVDCVSGSLERCSALSHTVEQLHQKLLAVLTSPLLQRIKCQLKHYTTQRPGVTAAQRNAAREHWQDKEAQFSFQVTLCGQGDLSSCQYLKQVLLTASHNSTRPKTPDGAVTVLCGNATNIRLLSPGDMALNLALSTRLEQRIRQLRDWIWGREMDDNWRDEQAAGWGPDYSDISLRTVRPKQVKQQPKPSVVELKPQNASEVVEEDPALPHVLRNYHPRLTKAQQGTYAKCLEMVDRYAIEPFRGWGRATTGAQADWKKQNCDQLLMIKPYKSDPETIVNAMKGQWSECVRMQAEYEIIPNVTWGTAASKVTWTWKRRNCDLFMWLKPPPPPSDPFWDNGAKASQQVSTNNKVLPSIAICIATTTRGLPRVNKMMDLLLFLHTLPALTKSLQNQFEYHLYLGYDKGDPYFDNERHLSHVSDWFTLKMKQILHSKQGIRITLHLHAIDNPTHKPGVAFNSIIDIAYRNPNVTHQYFFRMPDDFQILRAWPVDLVNALNAQPAPGGVVGLSNKEGRTDRFPAELVARHHLDILGSYYPSSLSDWWNDDWLSHVWGLSRTTRVFAYGVHRLFAHGTRFQVTHEHESLLQNELLAARDKIINWMKASNVQSSVIESYSNEPFEYSINDHCANFQHSSNIQYKIVNRRVVRVEPPPTTVKPSQPPAATLPSPATVVAAATPVLSPPPAPEKAFRTAEQVLAAGDTNPLIDEAAHLQQQQGNLIDKVMAPAPSAPVV